MHARHHTLAAFTPPPSLIHNVQNAKAADRADGHMPLCLVQHDDRENHELGDERALIDLNQAVCERDSNCRYLFTRQHFDSNVEPHWQKLLAVRAALRKGCQHAVWIDSDIAVHTSHAVKLLDTFEGRPFFANADPPPDLTPRFFTWTDNPVTAPLNAGIWGVKNTVKGRELLNAWIALYPSHLWSVERTPRRSGSSHTVAGCLMSRPEPIASGRAFRALTALFTRRATKLLATDKAHAVAAAHAGPRAAHESISGATQGAGALARTEQLVADGGAGGGAGGGGVASGGGSWGGATAMTLVAAPGEEEEAAQGGGCGGGRTTYSFHETWTCSGDPACDVWANSDAFEQGAFAAHLQTDPAWVEHITMANPRTHNAPCSSFDEAQRRSALTCHFLAEYAMPLQPVIADRVVSLTVSPL